MAERTPNMRIAAEQTGQLRFAERGDKMKSEQKYLVLENDKPYKTMTASEVAEHFGLTVKRARSICSSGERFRRSYTVERIPEEARFKPSIPLTLWKEWDEVRLMINPNAKRVEHENTVEEGEDEE